MALIEVSTSDCMKEANVQLLPCSIEYDGPGNIDEYFIIDNSKWSVKIAQ